MTATVEQTGHRPTLRGRSRARDAFGGGIPLALVAIAVTVAGFWPSFFSRLGEVPAAHMVHGMLATGWLVLVLVQASFIRLRRVSWHRFLGWLSVAWFVLLIATSCYMVIIMMAGTGPNPIPFDKAKIFAFSDVTALPLFIFAYAGAIYWRRDRHVHSRLMVITVVAGLLPAVARFFFGLMVAVGMVSVDGAMRLEGLTEAMHPTYIFVLVVLAIVILIDWNKDRLRWPFPFAFAWFAINYATFFPGLSSQWFDTVARGIAALG